MIFVTILFAFISEVTSLYSKHDYCIQGANQSNREAFTPSRAKDDLREAALALDSMLMQPKKIKPLSIQAYSSS